jgi:hypothetical protein
MQVKQSTSIHISKVQSFFGGCHRRGVDPGVILAQVVPPEPPLGTPDSRFPTSKLGDLLAAISHTLHDETLGFLERPTPPGSLELWIHASITSRSLGEAVERWIRFWRMVHQDQHTELVLEEEQARVTTVFLDDTPLDRSSFITWLMFLMLRLAG